MKKTVVPLPSLCLSAWQIPAEVSASYRPSACMRAASLPGTKNGSPVSSSRAAVAAKTAVEVSRTAVLNGLRQRVEAIERGVESKRPALQRPSNIVISPDSELGDASVPEQRISPSLSASPSPFLSASLDTGFGASRSVWAPDLAEQPWSLGDPTIDALLPRNRLDSSAVHEIKPRAYGDWAAALVFALRLAVRRRCGAPRPLPILWCHSTAHANELGHIYAPGLESSGIPAADLIVVETARACDALWAMEEGLGSHALALVVGSIDEADLTPSRRLALAASASRTPCLLLTAPDTLPAPAAATRWRVARVASAAHAYDPAAAGASRLELAMERCRGRPPLAEMQSSTVEWCHAASRFRLVAALADRMPGESGARLRAG